MFWVAKSVGEFDEPENSTEGMLIKNLFGDQIGVVEGAASEGRCCWALS